MSRIIISIKNYNIYPIHSKSDEVQVVLTRNKNCICIPVNSRKHGVPILICCMGEFLELSMDDFIKMDRNVSF